MIRTQGTVLRDQQGRLAMQADCQAACKSCGVRKVCSGSARSMALSLTPAQAQIYEAGQQVHVDITEEELLRLTLLAYILPCLLLITFALLASPWGDMAALWASLVGLVLGVGLSSWRARRRPPQIQFIPLQTETHHDNSSR